MKLGPDMYHQGVDLLLPKKWVWQLMIMAGAHPKNCLKCLEIHKASTSTSRKNNLKCYQVPVCFTAGWGVGVGGGATSINIYIYIYIYIYIHLNIYI